MAAITEIVEVEKDNIDRIHLFREGLFLRAYQRSAFLFLKNIRDYRAVKKHYKVLGSDVALLGFPSNLLATMVPPRLVEQTAEGHLSFPCELPFDEREYAAWFDTLHVEPAKTRPKTPTPVVPQPLPVAAPPVVRLYEPAPPADGVSELLKRLENFPIENSTPMQCMMFVSELRSELKKVRNGSL